MERQMRFKLAAPLLSLALAAVIASPALAADATTTDVGTLDKEAAEKAFPAKPPYSPYAGRNFPTRPFFGDTHLHTSFSMDAGAFGCRLGPRDAYRFAKGEEITASSGQRAKLSRPLDFLVVADHSDNMGFFPLIVGGNPKVLADPTRPQVVRHDPVGQGRRGGDRDHHQLRQGNDPQGDPVPARHAGLPLGVGGDDQGGRRGERSGPLHRLHRLRVDLEHRRQQPAPQRHLPRRRRRRRARSSPSPPCSRSAATIRATSGSGWPPTSRRPAARCSPSRTTATSATAACSRSSSRSPASRIDREYAETPHAVGAPLRSHADQGRRRDASVPLAQRRVRQLRALGQGQPRPQRAEEAGDAGVRVRALGAEERPQARKPSSASTPTSSAWSARPTRTPALAAVEEDNFFGKTSSAEPSATRAAHPFVKNPQTGLTIMGWETTASGYAAVWATENTREAIFDAMQRRETYATTGPRMIVRFFGGWDFEPERRAEPHARRSIGYTKGVPMGGDLQRRSAGQVADVPRRRAQGSDRREPRPHPDRQGLARCKDGKTAGANLRRGRVRRPQDRRRGPLQDTGRQHRGRAERDLDQHHRRAAS